MSRTSGPEGGPGKRARSNPSTAPRSDPYILGVGCRSAMMTLRERKTQYGIVVNLPADHTAETVNAAAIKAFASLPPHLKRTLTWDQGVEMARHRDLATTTGVEIYFAERSSPWQRGANENYNGLLHSISPRAPTCP